MTYQKRVLVHKQKESNVAMNHIDSEGNQGSKLCCYPIPNKASNYG
jgi:hypothetical protein